MVQSLPILLAQVKVGNTPENLRNEIHQIVYSLYQEKEVITKLYNYIMNSIKLQHRMDTIFMNSENSKRSDPKRLLLNLLEKINLKRSDKYAALSSLSIYHTWKIIKSHTKIINLKLSALIWNEEFKII